MELVQVRLYLRTVFLWFILSPVLTVKMCPYSMSKVFLIILVQIFLFYSVLTNFKVTSFRFNARSYFERALVLLDDNLVK